MPLGQPAEVAALHLNLHAAPWPVGDMRRHVEPRQRLAVLKRLSRDDVQAFHRDFYGANRGEFALSGDFEAHALRQQLQRLFGAWNSHSDYARAPQTGHYLGRLHFDLNARASPEDDPALFVAEHILGRKPLVSRLSQRLRERENLSYDIRSSLKVATFDNANWLTIQADYPRDDGQRLADIVREEVTRLIEYGIDEQELERAQPGIRGCHAVAGQQRHR